MTLPAWLDAFVPAPTALSWKQRAITVGGAFIGIGISALICGVLHQRYDLAWWLMAPLGASAAQVFAVPGSPMSQPWPIIGGHVLSALSGLIALHLFGHTSLAAATAVGLAVALMLQCRALHPSGGGTALLIVMSQISDWSFIVFPAATNAVLLVTLAMAWHRVTGHTYPQGQRPAKPHALALHRFDPADLESALSQYNQALSISRAEVETIIEQTEMQAYRRMAQGLSCAQIMTRKVHTIDASLNIRTAEKLMQRQAVNALPVTDRHGHVAGLLRIQDVTGKDMTGQEITGKQGAAGDVMLKDYLRTTPQAPASDLLDLFSYSERRYVVVLDDRERLAGIISKSDLMRALFRTG